MDSEKKCNECDSKLKNLLTACKFCESNKKNISIDFYEKIELKDTIELKVINPSLRSKDKLREKYFSGASKSANDNWVEKTQIINRDKNYYFEEVKDSKGKTVHRCEEKLSDHKGHGSDKFNNSPSNKQ